MMHVHCTCTCIYMYMHVHVHIHLYMYAHDVGTDPCTGGRGGKDLQSKLRKQHIQIP